MRRQSRLFAIAEYLRGRRTGVTALALADRFGVTLRTIYRDLDSLRDASLPLRADRGRGGGYALDKSYSLPPVNLTAREAALLLTLGRWATTLRLLPFTDTLASALDKVRAALSISAQRDLEGLTAKLQFIGIPAYPAPAEVRRAVEEAWFEQRPLWIRYRSSAGEVTEATVRIRAVLMDRAFTLLDCQVGEGAERRNFRLDRIERAK